MKIGKVALKIADIFLFLIIGNAVVLFSHYALYSSGNLKGVLVY